jgi:hypothetical protein
MDTSDEYFEYNGENEYKTEDDTTHDNNWGSHGWALTLLPLIDSNNPCMDKIYDSCTLIMTHYNISMHYQKEKCLCESGWDKRSLWLHQEEFVKALEDYWNNGMKDSLSEIKNV